MVDPNAAFKEKKHPLVEVMDNGETYYKIRCLLCNYERYISLPLWNDSNYTIYCPNCSPDSSWVRI
jgi:hypothetical protein